MKALGCQPVESTFLSKFWFQIVNLQPYIPGVSLPTPDYVHLTKAMLDNCEKMNLQPTEPFLTKVIQLYEMIVVRHGGAVQG